MKIPIKFLLILSVVLSVAFLSTCSYIKKLKVENLAYRQNVSVLMDSTNHYKVADSLNAIQVKELQLSLAEYKKYRQDDQALIEKLKADKAQTIIKTETKIEYEIKTEIRDSIIYKDTLKAFQYHDKWTDVIGLLDKDSVDLQIKNKEELMLVESLQRKKFLFFKLPVWLFGYKHKTLDVVSKNPNTTIVSTEYVNFR
ncbi:MAG: hypothetical protein J6X03_01425 [Bacilli bacterium]|nr:hypothetical protein [Bacilli bacterium]